MRKRKDNLLIKISPNLWKSLKIRVKIQLNKVMDRTRRTLKKNLKANKMQRLMLLYSLKATKIFSKP